MSSTIFFMEIPRYIYSYVRLAKKCQGKFYLVIKESHFILQKILTLLDCASSRTAVFKITIISTIQVKVKREKFGFGEMLEHNNKERHLDYSNSFEFFFALLKYYVNQTFSTSSMLKIFNT